MKTTTNYHLNQWDPGDRILRTEFNGDNGKIDSAIQGVRRDLTAETTARKAAETTAANAVAGAKSEAATAVAGAKAEAANAVAGARQEAAAANLYVKILEVTTSVAATEVDVDVSGIDFTQYLKVELFFTPPVSIDYYLRVNHLNANYVMASTTGVGGVSSSSISSVFARVYKNSAVILFFPPCASTAVGCVNFTTTSQNMYASQALAPCTWSNLQSFNFVIADGSNIPAGTKFMICGVKK